MSFKIYDDEKRAILGALGVQVLAEAKAAPRKTAAVDDDQIRVARFTAALSRAVAVAPILDWHQRH